MDGSGQASGRSGFEDLLRSSRPDARRFLAVQLLSDLAVWTVVTLAQFFRGVSISSVLEVALVSACIAIVWLGATFPREVRASAGWGFGFWSRRIQATALATLGLPEWIVYVRWLVYVLVIGGAALAVLL